MYLDPSLVPSKMHDRLPKSVLFAVGWFPEPLPGCGPRKQWRDFLQQDLKFIDVAESDGGVRKIRA